MEWAESQKLVKKAIKEDCRKFEEKMVEEIIEGTWSSMKWKNEMSKGRKITTGLRNKEGILVTKREEIIKTTTDFYSKLYSAHTENQQETQTELDEVGNDSEENECFFPILGQEAESILKGLKTGKAPVQIESTTQY